MQPQVHVRSAGASPQFQSQGGAARTDHPPARVVDGDLDLGSARVGLDGVLGSLHHLAAVFALANTHEVKRLSEFLLTERFATTQERSRTGNLTDV